MKGNPLYTLDVKLKFSDEQINEFEESINTINEFISSPMAKLIAYF
jgi:hypothetical protein